MQLYTLKSLLSTVFAPKSDKNNSLLIRYDKYALKGLTLLKHYDKNHKVNFRLLTFKEICV